MSPFLVSPDISTSHYSPLTLQNGHFRVLTRPLSVSDYGPFAKSFGLSEKIDGADGVNESDIVRESMDRGIFVCQAFSKVLIVRAIGRASPDPSGGGEGLGRYRLLKFPKLGI